MVFTKRLRGRVRSGEITSTVRFWMHPRVSVGGRYRMEAGEIEVDSIETIGFPDITPELARESGFLGYWTFSRLPSMGRVNGSIWYGFTTFRRAVVRIADQLGRRRRRPSNGEPASNDSAIPGT
jgi:hypothetical protein